MGVKDLKRDPCDTGDKDAWWYETEKGFEIVVLHRNDDGSPRYKGTLFTIPWRTIRAALRRKDK